MTQSQLAHTKFPLGSLHKTQVRLLAEENGFINADKPYSQDICFVPDGDYAAFLEHYTGKTYPAGDFISTNGAILGKHNGIIRYTLGKRRGIWLALDEPMYVKQINAKDNTIVLGTNTDLFSNKATVEDFNWISGEAPKQSIRYKAKIRYRGPEQWATVTPFGDTAAEILFDEPQRAITAGQAAVLYDGDTVLGGGTIK